MSNKKYLLAKKKFNDKTLIAYEEEHNFWDTTPIISLYDSNDNIILTHKLEQVRIFFDFVIFPEREVFGFLYTNYKNEKNTIFFEFYQIKNNTLHIVNKYELIIPYSNSNLEFKICNPLNNIYSLVYGDLTNYDFCDFIYFNEGGFTEKSVINNIESITDYYFYSKDMIVNKTIIAHDKKKISIGLNFLDQEKYFCAVNNIELDFNHKFDNPTEIDNEIIIMHSSMCLLQVKIISNIDILHIEENYIDILIDYKENILLDISKKYKIQESKNILSYIENKKIIHQKIKC